MKIKLRTPINITHSAGDVVEVDDARAKMLIDYGLAEPVAKTAVIKEKTKKAVVEYK